MSGNRGKISYILISLIPFVLAFALYMTVSHQRLAENPSDKITPSLAKMADAAKRMAFEVDERSEKILLWDDTYASLRRIFIGLGAAAIVALLLGLNMGLFNWVRVLFGPFTRFLAIVPPLAILPILFIVFGVEEFGKIVLIFIGSVFLITLDMYNTVEKIPYQQIVKAKTLGANNFEVAYVVVMPQIMPKLLESIRISLGPAWLFLIASEAIASTNGLGYRIFLMRRYLSMDVIIPYVLWITLLGFLMNLILTKIISWRYPWYASSQ